MSAVINDLFTPSYTRKKEAADGMDPSMAEGRPAYILRKVPCRVCRGAREAFCLCVVRLDCRRVLIVSRGYRETSTVRPASAPDYVQKNYLLESGGTSCWREELTDHKGACPRRGHEGLWSFLRAYILLSHHEQELVQ